MKKIIIGSRGSKLALLYAHKAKESLLNNASLIADDIQIKEIVTKGDQVQDKRLSEVGGKGLFSKNIEQELLDNPRSLPVAECRGWTAAADGAGPGFPGRESCDRRHAWPRRRGAVAVGRGTTPKGRGLPGIPAHPAPGP